MQSPFSVEAPLSSPDLVASPPDKAPIVPAVLQLGPPPARPPLDVVGTAFLILIVLAPLPLGSNRPLWWSLLALSTSLLLAIYGVQLALAKRKPDLPLKPTLAIAIPAALAILWGSVQSMGALPSALINPSWQAAAQALADPLRGAISLNPQESLTGVMRLATYCGIFLLALLLGRERRFADRFLRWFAGAGAIYALYGLIDHVLGFERLLWLPKQAYIGFLTSSFVNRNSYATYAALGLLCSAALLISASRDFFKNERPWRQQILAAIETITGPALRPLIAALVIAVALLQTGSRAGAASTLAGLIVLLLAASFARLIKGRQTLMAIGAMAVCASLFMAVTGGEIIDRLDSATMASDKTSRADIYALTQRAIADQPLLGTGLGTFPAVFSIYRPENFDVFVLPTKAHNSYLSNALELGVPATLALMFSLGAILVVAALGLKRRRRGQIFPILGLAALTTVALHSLVDFSLEIPAVAASYAALAGICCAQSFRSQTDRNRRL